MSTPSRVESIFLATLGKKVAADRGNGEPRQGTIHDTLEGFRGDSSR